MCAKVKGCALQVRHLFHRLFCILRCTDARWGRREKQRERETETEGILLQINKKFSSSNFYIWMSKLVAMYRIVPNLSPLLIIAPPLSLHRSLAMIQEKIKILHKNFIFKLKNVVKLL